MSVAAEPIVTARVVLLPEVVDLNPRPERGALSDDLEVSFVPMAAVEAATGQMDASTVRPFGEVKKGYTVFREGDVLFAKITPCMENGKMAVARGLRNGVGCGSTEFHVLRPRPGVDPHYVYYFVSSARFRAEAAHRMTGAVGQKRVPAAFLEKCEIPLPDLDEQRRIVAEIEMQFSRLDEAVANLKRVKSNLKRYKDAVLRAAVEGRLVPTEAELARREGRGHETGVLLLQRMLEARRSQQEGKGRSKAAPSPNSTDLPKLPEGWAWATVETVGDVLLGRQRAPQYLTGRFPRKYLRVANIKDDFIDFSDLGSMDFDDGHFAKYQLKPGDILVSEGQSPELLGQSAIFRGYSEPLCFQKTLHRFRANSSITSAEFAQTVFRSHVRNGVFRDLGSITTNIAHLTLEKFRAAPFPLPPLAEQHRIVIEVERRLSIAASLENVFTKNLQRGQTLRASALSALFFGARSDGNGSSQA